jgi:hypothetical protein
MSVAGPDEHLDEQLRPLDHQVRLDRQSGRFAHRFDDQRAECQVRNEVPVHNVDLDPIGAGGFCFSNLIAEPARVGREDRGNDLDGLRHLSPPP